MRARHGAGWLALLLVVAGPPAFASVGAGDLERAAREVERARAAAGEVGTALAEARVAEEGQRAVLAQLAEELAEAQARLHAARRAARQRARSLYIEAGDRPAGPAVPEEAAAAAVRAAYADAVGRADREVLNSLASAVADRERGRERMLREAEALREITDRVARLAADAGPALAAAEAEYTRLAAARQAEEAERLRREQSTTTSVPPASPATAPDPDPPDPVPAPAASPEFAPPVERWRALVARFFPAEMVDQALAVIACESLGDPAVVNPLSGVAGLFQHHPRYWPGRAAAAGFPGAPPEDPEANVAAAAWLVSESMAAGLDPWFFWACRP